MLLVHKKFTLENCYIFLMLNFFFPQIDKLKKEIETQQKEKAALESRENESERKTRELNSKLERVSSFFVV